MPPPEGSDKNKMDSIQGRLMTCSSGFLCSLKALTAALVCSAEGLPLLWQVLQECRAAEAS